MKILSILFLGLVFCACSSPSEPQSIGRETSVSPPTPTSISSSWQPVRFTATYNRALNSLVFVKVTSDIQPASVDSLTDLNGDGGIAPQGDVDLFTPTNGCVVAGAAPTGTVTCLVELTWGSATRTLVNPLVMIAGEYDITEGDASTRLDDAPASDGTNPLGLTNTHGLWNYTNAVINPGPGFVQTSGPYYLTAQGTGFNQGSRYWTLKNGSNDHIVYDITVYASLNFSNEIIGSGSPTASYVPACAKAGPGDIHTSLPAPWSTTLPFDFLIYNQLFVAPNVMQFAETGEITLGGGGTDLNITPTSQPPSNTYQPLAVWPFFDGLTFQINDAGSQTGKVCYYLSGTPPIRKAVVEWQSMTFEESPGEGAVLDFEAILNEGTMRVDLIYESMTCNTSLGDCTCAHPNRGCRWNGLQAIAGVQSTNLNLWSGAYDDGQLATVPSETYSIHGVP